MSWIKELNYRTDDEWIKMLDQIEDEEFKIKIASLVYWDFGGLERIRYQLPNRPKLRDLSRQYKPFMEEYITPQQIETTLLWMGYPEWKAKKRAIVPKQGRNKK